MPTYKHGAYGEFADSIGGVAVQSITTAVYVGVAPVNLIRGYDTAGVVNEPVLLNDYAAVKRLMGYSSDWENFSLCEAFKAHFDNSAGNAGPIVAINVLDPDTHKKSTPTTQQVNFVNGRATIASDKIILDTLVLADKVEGVDFTIDYDFTTGQVILESIASTPLSGNVQATFSEVEFTVITSETIIGGVTAAGVYTGLGAIDLIYQNLNLVPNLIAAPGWSDTPAVYNAMITAGTKINGHWDAFVVADMPLTNNDTIEKAITWRETNAYTNERSKIYWPQFMTAAGEIYHGSTLAVWQMLQIDEDNDGVPMETPSNKAVPIAKQYFGAGSTNRGFDQNRANELNANGISTAVYWGGQWVLWGGHTAAYNYETAQLASMGAGKFDNRVIFDNSIRMMMYVSNSFQQEWGTTIDEPMTLSLADTIKNREQEKADALVAIGALIGTPVVQFLESENSTADLVEGNFTWNFEGTPTPQFKSGTLTVAYTTEGFDSYFGEEA